MSSRAHLAAALAVLFLAPASLTLAPAGGIPGESDLLAESARERPPLPLADAILAAENHRPGSRVADAVLVKRGDKLIYEVKTLLVNEFWEGQIDAQAGTVVGAGTVTPVARLDQAETAELAAMLRSRLDLKDAVALAEKSTQAEAVSARLEERNGRVVFEVLVRPAGEAGHIVAVDTKDGVIRLSDDAASARQAR